MGKTIKLLWPEYEYKLPSAPAKETDILFHDRRKKDQYWHKPRMPEPVDWARWNARQRFLFIERERERWTEGVHFFNNGELTYITGKHYDHLTYSHFDYKVKYYDNQRHDWYFREMVKEDKFCYGGLKIKPRRYGSTDEEVTDNICEAINGSDKKIGMMSETRDKVYSTLYDKITTSYLQRPAFIRPEIFMRNGVIPKKKMEFRPNKVKKTTDGEMITYDMSATLNSLIEPKATTVIGYDGWKLHKGTFDEIWKWTACSPLACYEKQKKCFFDGGTVKGYMMWLSTMGDDEDYDEAIKDGIKMWHDSNPFERDSNGFTTTGLYRYFISGVYAFRDYADKYGFIDTARAEEYIRNEREKYVEGTLEHLFEMRRYPLTIEEALGSALVTGVFDKARIDARITIINKMTKSERPYFTGELIEDNQGRVHIEPDKSEQSSPWLFSVVPHKDEKKDRSNRWKKFDNKILAPLNPEGAIGYDPIRYADTDVTSNSLSNACIIAKYKFDYFREAKYSAAGKYAAMYLDRPDDPEFGHYEAYKCAKLYGFPIMYERQVESVVRRMRELFFMDFILLDPKSGAPGMWTDNQHKVIKNGIDMIQSAWKKPKEIWLPDPLSEVPFVPLLKQGRDFNPKKTTKFDAIMSHIMLEYGLLQIRESNISDDYDPEENMRKIIGQLFPKRSQR